MSFGKPPGEHTSTRRLGDLGSPGGPAEAPRSAPPRSAVTAFTDEPLTLSSPVELEITLGEPATAAGQEPVEPTYARVRIRPRQGAAVRPVLDLCILLDASASMHRFVLDPEQRSYWHQRAEQRGEVVRQQADGRTGLIWSGQTLRELQQRVSTPMLSALRGIWRTLEAIHATDRICLLGFADQWALIYEDAGAGDPTSRRETAKVAMSRLGSGVDQSGLGRGTRLAGALRHALERMSDEDPSQGVPCLRRLILVSDGIIEDAEECRPLMDSAVERGIVISVVGVGEDFDEEFLMPLADLARGNYYYAATAPEVEEALTRELQIASEAVGRLAVLRIQPENGTIIHDVFPISPSLGQFQVMWTEPTGWRFRIGDLSAAQETEFLVSLAPASQPPAEVRLGTVRVDGLSPSSSEPFATQCPIRFFFTDDTALLRARDDSVLDSVRRLEIYLEERAAASAAARGDKEAATRHLQAATRMLRSMGATELAEDMAAAAGETESGTRNVGRTKRVKAGTRKLGNP